MRHEPPMADQPPAEAGFLLPVLVLLLSLAGILTLSLAASTTQSARASAAALAQRQAFELAEDVLDEALRESARRPAPRTAEGWTPEGIHWQLTVRSLGDWPSTAPGAGSAIMEAHERATVVARTGRGATVRLEQDYARPTPVATAPMPAVRRTVWRELTMEGLP
jgi:Tfp pilus assembly protein PilX